MVAFLLKGNGRNYPGENCVCANTKVESSGLRSLNHKYVYLVHVLHARPQLALLQDACFVSCCGDLLVTKDVKQ